MSRRELVGGLACAAVVGGLIAWGFLTVVDGVVPERTSPPAASADSHPVNPDVVATATPSPNVTPAPLETGTPSPTPTPTHAVTPTPTPTPFVATKVNEDPLQTLECGEGAKPAIDHGTDGWWAYCEPALVSDPPPAGLPPCESEDSVTDCYWDATTRGNGTGISFVIVHGEAFPLEPGAGLPVCRNGERMDASPTPDCYGSSK